MICTFFGHREIYNTDEVKELLYDILTEIIEKRGIKQFLVGNSGKFDRLVLLSLRKLSHTHNIDYKVVLAYINVDNDECWGYRPNETVFPDILEKTPFRFAIDKRNRWMIKNSGMVVTYINNSFGGSAKYAEICEKKGYEIIKLGKI